MDTLETDFHTARDAFFESATEETARSYFYSALEMWKVDAIDEATLEYIAFETCPILCGKAA